ncbi:hypothetical protein MAHJHV61_33570 [Mycobacterium avium subsp. hominissuis]|jgi:hypothetical protein|uniref:Uncharacterized protein n=1 Tax=Mycolicibacter algericus TaxID=1288388 RepID=A0A7I9YC32_MYCAL|nr:hypothetical protein MALGJ_28820 [Mycolicibacter algericus]
MATHAMRKPANDIIGAVSMGIPGSVSIDMASPVMLTTDHHQPTPATPSRAAGNHASVHDHSRISVLFMV